MPDYKSLTHTRWDCKYHIVFIPKKRQKVIYGSLRKFLGSIFHELARRKGCEIVEGHLTSRMAASGSRCHTDLIGSMFANIDNTSIQNQVLPFNPLQHTLHSRRFIKR